MRYLLAASLFCQIGVAHALQHPQPATPLEKGGDPHVQVANFSLDEPTLIVGAVGRTMTITFSPSESIIRAVLGSVMIDGKEVMPWSSPPDAATNALPLGNVLPLWVSVAGRASAQVVTRTADNVQRVYQFRLIALPPQPDDCPADDCDDPRVTTGLTFIYPAERKAAAVNQFAVTQQRLAAEKVAAEARVKTDIFYGPRNWKYTIKGATSAIKHLAPDQISDNTQVTGLLYLGNRQAPAIYIVEADDSERQVSPTPDKDLLVLYETAHHWRLRKGTEVVDIFNVGFDDIGANPHTGTISPNVIRMVRSVPAELPK